MLSPRTLVDSHGGVARGVQLAAFGFTRHDLSAAVAKDEIRRVRPGVFISPMAEADAVLAAAHGGAVTCARALRLAGVWVLDDDEVPHVWLATGARTHPHADCSCVVHYRPGRVRLGIADVEHALIHSYGCHGAEFFFAAFESAWNKRLIGPSARARIRAKLPKGAKWLVDFARDDAESGLESLLRLRLHILGIPLDTQVEIPGVGRVDFVVAKWIILETDGRENHDGPSRRHRDLVRDAAASALGYEHLRFDYAMIVHDWPRVERAVLAAISRL